MVDEVQNGSFGVSVGSQVTIQHPMSSSPCEYPPQHLPNDGSCGSKQPWISWDSGAVCHGFLPSLSRKATKKGRPEEKCMGQKMGRKRVMLTKEIIRRETKRSSKRGGQRTKAPNHHHHYYWLDQQPWITGTRVSTVGHGPLLWFGKNSTLEIWEIAKSNVAGIRIYVWRVCEGEGDRKHFKPEMSHSETILNMAMINDAIAALARNKP